MNTNPVDAVETLREYVDFYTDRAQHRVEQESMTRAVQDGIRSNENVICQAGTGTGKSIAYINAVYASGRPAVIATATKMLSEQLINTDLPAYNEFLHATGRKPIRFALLKGRSNYACKMRLDQIERLESDSDAAATESLLDADDLEVESPAGGNGRRRSKADIAAYVSLIEWAKVTSSGDRSDAPPAPDWAWDQISVSASACLGGSNCPFAAQCFSEQAREAARNADIAVTNHALLAADLKNGGQIFGEFEIVVVDEVHEFEGALSDAWGGELAPRSISKAIKNAAKALKHNEFARKFVEQAADGCDDLEERMALMNVGRIDALEEQDKLVLIELRKKLNVLVAELSKQDDSAPPMATARARAAGQALADITDVISQVLSSSEEVVRWVAESRQTRSIRTAPVEVGERLQEALADRVIVATSATCTLGGSFHPVSRALGFESAAEAGARRYNTIDVGTPFDWPRSAMLYIPAAPFPEPVGKERREHVAAVNEELSALVKAAGGRTLFLSTTVAGATAAAEHLRNDETLNVNVYAYGDGTAAQLAEWFIDDETSVLCATMGMWAGLSPDGATCSVVVIDKIPFPAVDDPLTQARIDNADANGRSGFMDISVAQAGILLAQGAGRLIRSASDKGVVAILDRRLTTKRYGQALIGSLPEMRMFTDQQTVLDALTRLTGGLGSAPAPNRPKSALTRGKTGTSGGHGTRSTRSTTRGKAAWGRGAKPPVTRTRPKK